LFAHRLLVVIHRIFHAKDDRAVTRSVRERFESVGDIEFARQITRFLAAEMPAVAPTIQKIIRRTDNQNDAFVLPRFGVRNFDVATVPANFVARREAMIFLGDLERVEINARGIIIFVSSGIRLAPRRSPAHRFFRSAPSAAAALPSWRTI
jgi:hypothetical protein